MRPRLFAMLKEWSRVLRRDVHAIWFAARDPRVPWYAKVLGLAVAAYALSPIDLIPDFIPVLGYLDDLILVPLGIALVVKLIPANLMAEHRAQASCGAGEASQLCGHGRHRCDLACCARMAGLARIPLVDRSLSGRVNRPNSLHLQVQLLDQRRPLALFLIDVLRILLGRGA